MDDYYGMTVDEILSDTATALGLPEGAVTTHIVVLVEYCEPGEDDSQYMRLASIADDTLAPWTMLGMIQFAQQLQNNDIAVYCASHATDDTEDEE